jgi:hypothetical protein
MRPGEATQFLYQVCQNYRAKTWHPALWKGRAYNVFRYQAFSCPSFDHVLASEL